MRERGGSRRENPARGRSVALCLLLSLGLGGALGPGCAAPPPPRPPPPPEPSARASSLAPTLVSQVFYTPSFRLGLRLDGKPFNGKAWLLPGSIESQDAALPPFDGAVELDVTEGAAPLADTAVQALAQVETFHMVVDGHRYPFAQGGGTHAFRCAVGIAALRAENPCEQPLPEARTLPPMCDEAGQNGWLSVLADQTSRQSACWPSLDEPTLASVRRIQERRLRLVACEKLLKLAGPDPGVELGLRIFDPCEESLPQPLRDRVTLARRTAELPAAYESAQQGSSAEMHAFYDRYRVTGDPRVEALRRLAARRFGPRAIARFVAADRALRSLSRAAYTSAWLCDVRDDAALVVLQSGGITPEIQDPFSQADLDPRIPASRYSRVVALKPTFSTRPPAPLVPPRFERTVTAMLRARLGVQKVNFVSRCQDPHWYLHPPAAPSPPAPPPRAASLSPF